MTICEAPTIVVLGGSGGVGKDHDHRGDRVDVRLAAPGTKVIAIDANPGIAPPAWQTGSIRGHELPTWTC